MKVVDVSVKRPVGVVMVVLAILALGFVSLKNLAVDLFPNINLPIVVVATSYQGAGPQEVENLVSRPVESAISSVQGVNTIQSTSQPNSSLVVLMFDSGVNLDAAVAEVREKVDQMKSFLPENANDPSVLRFDPQQIPVMAIGLNGDKPEVLQDIAESKIVPMLERVNGVGSVSVQGGKTREIQLELNRAEMKRFGVSSGQIIQALSGENRSASAGVIAKGDKELQIRVDGEYTDLDHISNTLLPLPQGGQIRISDVAELKDTYKQQNSLTKVNGESALILSVQKRSNANTVKVANGLNEAMDKINQELGDRAKLSVVMDTSLFIKESISSVVSNMIMGGAISVLILLLFLRSFRATLVIGLSIPIAVISTFTLMYFTGQTVNVLSMGGLALGIGMMVDCSIIILENITRHRRNGAPIMEAAKKGASELGSAVIASTTTSIVVFLPIVFVEGIASDLFVPLALAVSFSLIASLVVSLTLVPMLSSKLLKLKKNGEDKGTGKDGRKRALGRFFAWFGRILNVYKGVLKWVLSHRKTTVFLTIAVLVGSLALTPFIGMEFFPASDQGEITISIETDAGSNLHETEKVTEQVDEVLKPYADIIETNYLSVGGGGGPGMSSGTNTASYNLSLVSSDQRNITTSQMMKEWQAKLAAIPGGDIVVSEEAAGLGTGTPVQIQINGPDFTVLTELSEQVVWTVSQIEGIHNAQSSISAGRPEIRVHVDREAAAQYGLSFQQVLQEAETGFNGRVATRYREDGYEYDVRILLPEGERQTISDLESMMLPTATGQLIPLSAVAELQQVVGPSQIQRQNQERQVNVTSDIVDRDLGGVIADINAALSGMNFPDGYSYSMGGQAEDMMKSFQDLAMALVFSIFLVYIVMAVQFESVLHPLVIMFAMPTMFVGVMLGLFITGKPLSVPALIGVIMLAGIVVNNAIVLIDYINTLRGRGVERTEAILEAGTTRLRPIWMTTLTTVLAMIPLALGIGEGGESQAPLAVVIIFGLMVSSCFTLFLVPVMYTLFDDMSGWFKRRFKRNKKSSPVVHTGVNG
ncbi:efflux RND transporter permease subunit [Paenibacillus sp. J2TS4]|uniref:efflux RND transporter permease subunit n=1 Tax=Paenibacillus sp. J2TS4 TaxID=2807194 RepID=UPI001B0CF3B5|nr:efflux RND transporter permease subunit [Paenibacillus sp. J2TS4]GIP35343.1 multidrug ABC transporter [Paenibacillus sp. J2TS4]